MENLIVQTRQGVVEGFCEQGVNQWFGIPFAQPPVGELRFKRARDPKPWEGVRSCKEMGSAPVQFVSGEMAMMAVQYVPNSEDCLYLNVWAPEKAEKAPVFVWIYGGANHMGEASSPVGFLDSFARNGVVGVNFNYRVGPLGFYDFSHMGEQFESNCAVSDMIAALKWVHENIEAFGGDPENVTICGESAGGTAVYCMLTAPSARGYFQKAIAMSGLAANVYSKELHHKNLVRLLDRLGLDEGDGETLFAMSAEELNKGVEGYFTLPELDYPGILLLGPVIDDLLPKHPWEALAEGNARDVKCIFGTCRDEGTLFYPMKQIPQNWDEVQKMLENNGCGEKLADFRAAYPEQDEKDAMLAIGRDRLFWSDSIRCSLAQIRYNTVYSYRFDFVTGFCKMSQLGATHAMDVGPALNTWAPADDMFNQFTSKEDLECIHDHVHGAYVRFAKTGDPNGGKLPHWPVYTAETRDTLLFDSECTVIQDPYRQRFELWDSLEIYL